MPKQMPPVETDTMPPTARNQPAPGASALAASRREEPSAGQSLDREEAAALSEILRRREEGAEVICVVRPRTDPRAKSEIFVLDKVSPAFLEGLAKQVRAQDTRHLTSLEVPRAEATRGQVEDSAPPSAPIWSPPGSREMPSGSPRSADGWPRDGQSNRR